MNIYEALKELDKLRLPKDKYVIVSSGALAIRGIRDAGDLDVLVASDLWEELKNKYKLTKIFPVENIDIGNIQLMNKGSSYLKYDLTFNHIYETAEDFGGHKFANLKVIFKVKKNEGRDKDIRDLKLIEKYWSGQNGE